MSTQLKKLLHPYILVYIIALSIGLYFRLFPLLQQTPSEKLSQKATLIVVSQLRAKIIQQINQNQPQLHGIEKTTLIQTRLNTLLQNDQKNFQKTRQRIIKSMQKKTPSSSKKHYLLASDSFYYYNLTDNIVNTGKISDTIKGSKYLNKLMLAPAGHWEPFNLHPYIGYFIYRTLQLFNPDISLMYAVSFTSLLITSLSLIPFLFICAFYGCRLAVAFTSSIFFLLAPIFVKRSTFAWYDNDPYSIFFSLTLLALFFYGLASSSIKKKNIFAVLIILTITLYSFFWQGWMLVFCILLASAFFILINNHFIQKQYLNTKNTLIYFAIIFGGGFVGVSVTFGPQEFFILFAEGWKALQNFLIPQLSIWPDLYISVSELHNANLSFIINMTGGKIVFTVAMLGLTHLLFSFIKRNLSNKKQSTAITLITFLTASLIITKGAQRFALLCVIPLSLLFAVGLQEIQNIITKLLFTTTKFKHSKFILSILILSMSIFPIQFMHKAIRSLLNPIFNQTWKTTLTHIQNNTPENSIVNTWWPPGHFIKAIAKRHVTFDGASINYPQAYWISNFFLSQTEKEALGILRMINNSGNQASEYLHETLGLPLSTSVNILKKITQYDRKKAYQILKKGIPEKSIQHLLKLTHDTPPPSYTLIYNEFVENNLQLKFIGGWNFKEIEAINKSEKRLNAVPPRSSPEYVNFLWLLAGGPYKYSGQLNLLKKEKNNLTFQENITINLNDLTCHIDSNKYGKGIPKSIFYLEENNIKEKILLKATLPYSIVLHQKSGTYQAILADRPLANSMLFRLYFFEGKGLKYFQPFSHEKDTLGITEIDVFEVNWKLN